MKVLNIIERENDVQQNVSSYPILEEANEAKIIEAVNEHFKQLIRNRLDEQSQWDKDIYNTILEDTGFENTDEFLNQCVEEGYFGYPHDNDVEYQISWGTVFNLNDTVHLDYVFNKK